MKGIKLSLLGIAVILAGIAIASYNVIAMAAGFLGVTLAFGSFFVNN